MMIMIISINIIIFGRHKLKVTLQSTSIPEHISFTTKEK